MFPHQHPNEELAPRADDPDLHLGPRCSRRDRASTDQSCFRETLPFAGSRQSASGLGALSGRENEWPFRGQQRGNERAAVRRTRNNGSPESQVEGLVAANALVAKLRLGTFGTWRPGAWRLDPVESRRGRFGAPVCTAITPDRPGDINTAGPKPYRVVHAKSPMVAEKATPGITTMSGWRSPNTR